MEHHLQYGITQCYLSLNIGERASPNPSSTDWYSICLPWRDWRLSWFWCWRQPRWFICLQTVTHWRGKHLIANLTESSTDDLSIIISKTPPSHRKATLLLLSLLLLLLLLLLLWLLLPLLLQLLQLLLLWSCIGWVSFINAG